jgi:ankyrin repeat protein
MARLLIAKGATVNRRDGEGQTALHLAANCGHADVVRILINARAAVNATDYSGKTPLDEAVRISNDNETAELLRNSGGKEGKSEQR